jgi:hypothetical protein
MSPDVIAIIEFLLHRARNELGVGSRGDLVDVGRAMSSALRPGARR